MQGPRATHGGYCVLLSVLKKGQEEFENYLSIYYCYCITWLCVKLKTSDKCSCLICNSDMCLIWTTLTERWNNFCVSIRWGLYPHARSTIDSFRNVSSIKCHSQVLIHTCQWYHMLVYDRLSKSILSRC